MVSFIIVSKDSTAGMDYISQQCDILHISPYDRFVLRKDTVEKVTQQSIGIAEVKILQKKIYLKPMQGSDKVIILQDAAALTNEAQNALLKVLEEPPEHTYIYVLTDTLYTLLPTICSRCKIIQIDQPKEETSTSTALLTDFLSALPSLSISHKLHIAEVQGKQKQGAIEWLENMQSTTRNLLAILVQEDKRAQIQFYIHLAKNIQLTRDTIQETNVNVRLALEHLLLINNAQ